MTNRTLRVLTSTRPNPGPVSNWAWVSAAPFRAHVRHTLTQQPLPWRAFADFAQVPDNVVRGLLGVGRRPTRWLPPHYAQALLAVTPGALAAELQRPVDAHQAALAAQALTAAGWPRAQIATVCCLAEALIPALLDDRVPLITRHSELLLAAAVRAHGLEPQDMETAPASLAA